MTYMGVPYYPAWLDNLADDVTLEAAAMDGAAHGAEAVGPSRWPASSMSTRNSATPDLVATATSWRTTPAASAGTPTFVVVLVSFDAAGANPAHRGEPPATSAMLPLSRVMLEKFAGTPYEKHWHGTP